MGARDQGLEPCSAAFTDHKQRVGSKVEQQGAEMVPITNAGIKSEKLAC